MPGKEFQLHVENTYMTHHFTKMGGLDPQSWLDLIPFFILFIKEPVSSRENGQSCT